MPTILIDEEVQSALIDLAVNKGLAVFSPETPNLVLRDELGVGQRTNQSGKSTAQEPAETHIPGTASSSPPQSQPRVHQRIGPRLLREHAIAGKRGYFHKDGIAYEYPYDFPAVFFDPSGYLLVKDETSMKSNPQINVGKKISIPSGVSSVRGYHQCEHSHI